VTTKGLGRLIHKEEGLISRNNERNSKVNDNGTVWIVLQPLRLQECFRNEGNERRRGIAENSICD